MTVGLQIPDLSSYETFVDGFPHDAFVQLREHAPVWWHEPTVRTPDGEGFWCVQIRAGEKVVVWEMSANRDGAVFDEPFEFRIDRSPNGHVGFGHGPHFCLGANLARLEIDVMLNAVLDRWHDIDATGEPTYTRTNRLSGLRTLPIAFTDTGPAYA